MDIDDRIASARHMRLLDVEHAVRLVLGEVHGPVAGVGLVLGGRGTPKRGGSKCARGDVLQPRAPVLFTHVRRTPERKPKGNENYSKRTLKKNRNAEGGV